MLHSTTQDNPQGLPFLESEDRNSFREFLKPRIAKLLAAFRLDATFHRARRDSLYYRDDRDREIEVIDFLGGYGASLFGHNHPELVARAEQALAHQFPFHAQASVRSYAGQLARVLSECVGRTTGRSYVVTLGNSGTEAIEAAIKHAELERHRSHECLLEATLEEMRRLRIRLREGSAYVAEDFLPLAANLLGEESFASVDSVLRRLEAKTREILETDPVFLAIEGSFHGKSTGALQLTHRREFRAPWGRIGVAATFIPRDDTAALEEAIQKSKIRYLTISYEDDGKVDLEWRNLVNISACFCEPIQGEGGIHQLGSRFMRSLRKSADEYGFPLVIDEIQSGMGRCGTFLASEQSGVRGDYYLLSKALGGGLAKISALLVDRQHYREEFGYLHTSTFADDDYSSFIALGAMELLDRNGGELIDQCKRKGDALLRRLRSLQAKFPKQIAEVRGEGLMIGIELAPQNESASPLVRVLSEQKVISYLACGYLLAQHGIRMAPTLSEQAVLRVEPSAYISDDACERLYAGLGDFLTHLSAGNIQQLVGFMVGRSGATPAPPAESHASAPAGKGLIKPDNRKRRVAFLVHFTTTTDLRNWEPGLSSFSEAECATFLERTEGLLHPFVTHETEITSATGETIRLVVIGVPFTAAQAIESMRDGSDWCLGMVREGLQLARELECNVVGLGGHTSIVCDSGRDLVEDEIVLTSGNSLTVAVIQDVLLHTVERVGLQPERCRLGVVGAAGNVGATVAELISEKAGRIVLIGRRGAERFLQPVAERLYTAAFERLVAGQIDGGIAKVMMRSQIVQKMLGNGRIVSGDTGEKIYFGLVKEMGTAAPIQISQSMEELQTCEIIVSATNAPQSVVNASHIGDGPVVVCDVAVPQDVDPLLISQRPNATVIRGGMLRAPLGQSLGIPGMGLRSGELYACLAETILLGFVGASNHYSYGPLSVQRVRQIREWAWMHGFETFDSRIEQRQ